MDEKLSPNSAAKIRDTGLNKVPEFK